MRPAFRWFRPAIRLNHLVIASLSILLLGGCSTCEIVPKDWSKERRDTAQKIAADLAKVPVSGNFENSYSSAVETQLQKVKDNDMVCVVALNLLNCKTSGAPPMEIANAINAVSGGPACRSAAAKPPEQPPAASRPEQLQSAGSGKAPVETPSTARLVSEIKQLGLTPDSDGFWEAIRTNNTEAIRLFICSKLFGVDQVFTPPPNFYRPLWAAAELKAEASTRVLLQMGANPNFVIFPPNQITYKQILEKPQYETIRKVFQQHEHTPNVQTTGCS